MEAKWAGMQGPGAKWASRLPPGAGGTSGGSGGRACWPWGLGGRFKPRSRTSEASWATAKPAEAARRSVIAKNTRILLSGECLVLVSRGEWPCEVRWMHWDGWQSRWKGGAD